MAEQTNITIKSWAQNDRPREKLLGQGRKSLSDAELIAILIGSGSRSETAVGLSQRILSSVSNELHTLGQLEVADLMKFKGIGEAKAVSIVAALELGRRRKASGPKERQKISCSKDIFDMLEADFQDLKVEEFWIILLDRSLHVISKHIISQGGVSGTVVDPKTIFKLALSNLASCVVLAHNHPSGNLKPSKEDLRITEKLVNAGKFLDISITDHVIMTDNGYYSFCDNDLI